VFSRKQSDVVPPATSPQPEPLEPVPGVVGAGKGRPTPKRRTAEAANKRPLVPTDRKAAAKSARAAAKAERDRQFQAMQTGDERYLPAKDRGPVRRYVRDHVDARRNLGEFFLPVAMVFVLLTLLFGNNVTAAGIVILALYAVVFVTIIDAFIMWRGLRKKLAAKFGDDAQQLGLAMYAVLRVFQLRRARLPKPQVKRGQYPA
jgi:Flp pilus assembly protein TadB